MSVVSQSSTAGLVRSRTYPKNSQKYPPIIGFTLVVFHQPIGMLLRELRLRIGDEGRKP